MPAHTHQSQEFTTGANGRGTPAIPGQATPDGTNQPLTESTGSGDSMENQPPFVDVNFIIKT